MALDDESTQIVCQTCRRPLQLTDWPGTRRTPRWDHYPNHVRLPDWYPHEPIPVEAPYMDGRHVCDFCGVEDPVWAYRCGDFVSDESATWTAASLGSWAACHACSDLIEADEWEALAAYCVTMIESRYGKMTGGAEKTTRTIQGLFREHRVGDRVLETDL